MDKTYLKNFYDFICNKHKDYYTFADVGNYDIESMVYFNYLLKNRNNHQKTVHDYFARFNLDCSKYYDELIFDLKRTQLRNDIIEINKNCESALQIFSDNYFDFIFLYENVNLYGTLLELLYKKINKNRFGTYKILSGIKGLDSDLINLIESVFRSKICYHYNIWYIYKDSYE